ncbi:MGMT family protein [Aliamphritea ceti]|uniref:MGMT family protein n=1 Tax=Aliamphritea ceti TaxID=1524258 RepID=UPI0021C39D16|nr:MGMT family protein [Aliamphritea ceti]
MAVNEMHQRVWQVLGQIPAGKVVTYGQVAELAGLPGQSRMVGRCLGKLPEGSQLPWHRVINSQGKISLPVGSESYDCQVGRLQEEGVAVINGRIKLSVYRWQP